MLTLLVNARVLDMTGREPVEGAALAIENGRIREIAASGRVPRPAGARVVDCGGHTVMPGLTDAHVHVLAVEANILEQHRALPPSLAVLKAGVVLREVLLQGYTTVRDCGGADWGVAQAVATGVVPGPRLLVSGRPISQTGGHGDCWVPAGLRLPKRTWLPNNIADGVDEVRKVARELLMAGADFLK
ncbi:MAG: amidohydrolase family protein, partial [Candidatus Rokuibacteriota bacterium]